MSESCIQKIHNEIVRAVFGTPVYDTNDFPCYVNWLGTHYAIVDRVYTISGQYKDLMTCLSLVKTGEGYSAVRESFREFGPELNINICQHPSSL